jgi:hypothetical protein
VRGSLGITQEHDLAVVPTPARNAREASPLGSVEEQRMAGQLLGVHPFEHRAALLFVEGIEVAAAPAGFVHLQPPRPLPTLAPSRGVFS